MTELQKLEYLESLELLFFQKVIVKIIRDSLHTTCSISDSLRFMKNDFFEEFRMKNHIKNARFLFKKHQKQFEKVLIDAEKRTNRYPEQFII